MKEVKKLLKCHNLLISKAKLPTNLLFKEMTGGVIKAVENVLCVISSGEVKNISDDRIINYCIYNVNRLSGMPIKTLQFFKHNYVFGKKSIDMYVASPSGANYYNGIFLESIGLSKNDLRLLIVDRDKHPLNKWISTPHEDSTRKRLHNTNAGFIVCKQNTSMWSPTSKWCNKCSFKEKCQDILKTKNSELYRLRKEWESKQ